jgi:hypothetical protein
MTQITYIKSSLRHSSALTAPEVALTQFGLWKSIKRAFKKYAKPLAVVAGIALAIAVPFIAAPVAGMIFANTALAAGAGTFGATIGGALAGAGLGAVSGALTAYGTGQNVLMGAALGGLGGGVGGGFAGYAGGTLGAAGSAAGTAGTAGTTVASGTAGTLPANAQIVPTSAAIGNAAASTIPGQVGVPVGQVAAGATSAGMSTVTKGLLEATLKVAPSAVGTLVSSLAPSDVGQATAELQAEMQRLQNSDIDAYNKAKVLYDQLYARYQQIDPVAAAQLAEADVQMKTAGLISGVNVARGAASAEYAGEAEKRRLGVQGSQEASGAYTGTYYQGEGEKTRALAGLSGVNPRYTSSSGNYLANRVNRAEAQQAGLTEDITAGLTPYTLALAPRDTTVTSEDYDRLLRENDSLRRRRLTEDSLTGA